MNENAYAMRCDGFGIFNKLISFFQSVALEFGLDGFVLANGNVADRRHNTQRKKKKTMQCRWSAHCIKCYIHQKDNVLVRVFAYVTKSSSQDLNRLHFCYSYGQKPSNACITFVLGCLILR